MLNYTSTFKNEYRSVFPFLMLEYIILMETTQVVRLVRGVHSQISHIYYNRAWWLRYERNLSDLQVKGEFSYHTANNWSRIHNPNFSTNVPENISPKKSSMWHKVMNNKCKISRFLAGKLFWTKFSWGQSNRWKAAHLSKILTVLVSVVSDCHPPDNTKSQQGSCVC